MNPYKSKIFEFNLSQRTIPSFLVTIGLVNATIGGLNDRTGLFSLGLAAVGVQSYGVGGCSNPHHNTTTKISNLSISSVF
jgi:hypothetical protein